MAAAASSSNNSIETAWQQALEAYSSSSSSSDSSLAGPSTSTSTSAASSFLQVARERKTIRDFISSYDATTNHTINGVAPLIPTPVQEAQRLLSSRGQDEDLAKLIDEALVQRVERSAREAVEELAEGELGISSAYDKSICGLLRGLVQEKEGAERVREGLGMGSLSPYSSNVISQTYRLTLTTQLSRHPAALNLLRVVIDTLYMTSLLGDVMREPQRRQYLDLMRDLPTIGLEDHVRLIVESEARRAVEFKVKALLGLDDGGGGAGPHDVPLGFDVAARPHLVRFIEIDLARATEQWVSFTESGGGRQGWIDRFTFFMDTILAKGRAKQLFDLIADWPESMPAVGDLKESIHHTNLRIHVATTLTASLRARLLHPGARTRDILQLYVSLVYAVRHIDPPGVVLSRVAGPIRRYLRSRPDIVHVIVSSLLGGGDEDDAGFEQLRSELDAAAAKVDVAEGAASQAQRHDVSIAGDVTMDGDSQSLSVAAQAVAAASSSAAGRSGTLPGSSTAASAHHHGESLSDYSDPLWLPRPIDAGPSYRQSASADVIAMLVSIFEDRATFVKALEVSMAQSLLKSTRGYDVQLEYRNNEVLKRRFGDTALARCDVMLQDVVDSRRVGQGVWGLLEQAKAMDAQRSVEGTATPPPPVVGLPASVLSKLPKDYARDEATMRAMKPLITSRHFWPDLEGTEAPPPTSSSNSTSAPTAPGGGSRQTLGSVGPPPGGLDLKLPGTLGRSLSHYNRAFSAVRESRRLRWMSGYGSVQIKVEMRDGRTWSERVDPIKAAVLVKAGEEGAATPDNPLSRRELAEEMGVVGVGEGERLLEAAFQWCVAREVLVEVEGRQGWFIEAEATAKSASE